MAGQFQAPYKTRPCSMYPDHSYKMEIITFGEQGIFLFNSIKTSPCAFPGRDCTMKLMEQNMARKDLSDSFNCLIINYMTSVWK